MKHPNIDVETDAGLDGAETADEDDPGKAEHDDYVRATRVKDPKHQGRRGTREHSDPRPPR